jgi:2-octaprenyl-6-methoxyphenol hydroxylase
MLRNYTYDNILAFGDLIHRIHPLAGQGFNMTLRDLKLISSIIDKKMECGLEIDKSTLLEFRDKSKHINYIFGVGINFINEFFKLDSEFEGKISENIFSLLDKSEFFKRNSISIANKGINFAIE